MVRVSTHCRFFVHNIYTVEKCDIEKLGHLAGASRRMEVMHQEEMHTLVLCIVPEKYVYFYCLGTGSHALHGKCECICCISIYCVLIP